MPVMLWRVEVAKLGSTEVYEKKYFIAENYFQLASLVAGYIYMDKMYPFDVEILSTQRILEVDDIVNARMTGGEVDDVNPFEIDGIPDDDLIIFKHTSSCGQTIKVLDSEWESISCPTCKGTIYKNELECVGGIWIYKRGSK